MSYLKNKLQDKMRKYLRRKNRVNTQIKSHHPEYRLLVDKSNLYISAQVIDQKGNIVACTTDKKAE